MEAKIKSVDGDLLLFNVELAKDGKYFQILANFFAYRAKPPKPDKPKTADAMRETDWRDGKYDPSKIFGQQQKETGGRGTLLGS